MHTSIPRCRNACPSAHLPRGWTLIELMVVVALTSLLMGMLVGLLSSLLRYHRAAGERVVQRTEMDRLIDTLRADLRHAVEVTPEADGRLTIALDTGESICYRLDGARCRRTQQPDRCTFAARAKVFTIGPADAWRVEQQRVAKQLVKQQSVQQQPVEQRVTQGPQTMAVWIDRPIGDQSRPARPSIQIVAQNDGTRKPHNDTE